VAQRNTKLIFSFKFLVHVLGLRDPEDDGSKIFKTMVAIYRCARCNKPEDLTFIWPIHGMQLLDMVKKVKGKVIPLQARCGPEGG